MLPNLNREEVLEATANDLRSRPKKLLETVNRGEEVVITYHGKPCARLVPYLDTKGITLEMTSFEF
ncbi:MAG: hypothetical protein A2075_18665 [Geobacteraceae bacterium GWC2_58_44]|nr:MAG: hypothetical protein A2075_18665 [Geobacteraceae bacterium GWC2_58_44]